MGYFTESPYEGLMRQKPEAGRTALSPEPPLEGRCRDCPYGSARPCIGICLRELIQAGAGNGKRKERKRE